MKHSSGEERLQQAVARVLSTGRLLAVLGLLAGLGWAFARGGLTGLQGPTGTAWPAWTSGPWGVFSISLLVLVLTPTVGVATAAVQFVRRREWPFVVVAGTVLAILVGAALQAFL